MWFRRRDKPNNEAQRALRDAESNLERVKDRGDEITELADAFREFRQRNHFAEQIEEIISRRRRSLP